MKRLHPDHLDLLAQDVQVPLYDRGSLRPGILHLGLGAFHRAHQAVYTERALAAAGGDWGIIGVSMRSDTVPGQLNPQRNLYSVMSEEGEAYRLRLVGAIVQTLQASRQPAALIEAFANPAIQVITLTVTEKAYCLAADSRSLDAGLPAVSRDLEQHHSPTSLIGILALGLKQRHHAGGFPVTLVSCDNLSGNGHALRTAVLDYLDRVYPEVVPWAQDCLAFPNTMVDRIVPAMTAQKRQLQSMRLGLRDEAAVSTEPFMQWIIEDRFAAGRPSWEKAGVQFVRDIAAYETIKLRLLNAGHSAVAYSGLLAGLETVDQVVTDRQLGRFIQGLVSEELMPALAAPQGFDLTRYVDDLLARFSNPCLAHRCAQIAMDGTEKIPQRWLPTLQESAPVERLLKGLACWCYMVLHTDLPLEDPRGSFLLGLRVGPEDEARDLDRALRCVGIYRDSWPAYADLRDTLLQHMKIIGQQGVRGLLG